MDEGEKLRAKIHMSNSHPKKVLLNKHVWELRDNIQHKQDVGVGAWRDKRIFAHFCLSEKKGFKWAPHKKYESIF